MCYHSPLTYQSSTDTLMKFEIRSVHGRPRFPAAEAGGLPRRERARQKPPERGGGKRCPRSAPCRQQPAAAPKTRGTTSSKRASPLQNLLTGRKGLESSLPLLCMAVEKENCLTPGNNRVRAGSGCGSSSSSCWYGRCSTLFHSALIAVFHQLKARQLSAGGSS